MEVNDKIMYHFHKNGVYDKTWHRGNTIDVDESFEGNLLKITRDFDTNVNGYSFEKYLRIFLNKEYEKGFIDGIIKNYNKRKEYLELLEIARCIIWDMNIFKREMALEEVRKEFFPSLPSRRHSIWVCDDKSIEFWSKRLAPSHITSHKLSLFEVSLTGKLFKSSENLLPGDNLSYEECIDASFDYWNPHDIDDDKAEYLFQGKVKVL
ncbi:MAG: DUF2441 domain-containing protein [Bacilli bacterium]|nr:DUF2441 domain-containing protein [Bacilli bacterium]